MGLDIDLTGLDGVLGLLDGLTNDELIPAAHAGLRDGLQDIRSEAAMLCPKDTGALANSIKTRITRKTNAVIGEVYAGKRYAIYVEMGTGPKGERSHAGVDPERAAKVTYSPKGWVYPTKDGEFRYTEGMPARPFLYPAFKSQQGKVYKKVANAVMRSVTGG